MLSQFNEFAGHLKSANICIRGSVGDGGNVCYTISQLIILCVSNYNCTGFANSKCNFEIEYFLFSRFLHEKSRLSFKSSIF